MSGIKKFIVLGVSAGLNRAGLFLLMPLLASLVSVRDFGELSLYLSISSLLVAILSVNISSVIAREVYDDLMGVLAYLKAVNIFLGGCVTVSLLFFVFTDNYLASYFMFLSIEAMFLVNSTYIRYKSGDVEFFKITIMKFSVLIFTTGIYFLIVTGEAGFNISWFFVILAVSNVSVMGSAIRFASVNVRRGVFWQIKSKRSYMLFAITLLPHTFALWINSGLDRYFVKYFYDAERLGAYSFAYSLASLFLLINAALSLALPQFAVKDIGYYKSKVFYSRFVVLLTILYVVFLCALYFLIPYFVKYAKCDILLLSSVIVSGFYFLAFYTYFSAILFFERRSKLISSLTVMVAVIAILLLYPFSSLWGLEGTAMVTFVCYAIYASFVCCSIQYRKLLKLFVPLSVSVLSIGFIYMLSKY